MQDTNKIVNVNGLADNTSLNLKSLLKPQPTVGKTNISSNTGTSPNQTNDKKNL
jgi:hypothetical protein